MSFWSRLGNLFGVRTVALPPDRAGRTLAGGRVSIDSEDFFFGMGNLVLSPPDHESDWRLLELDTQTLSTLAPSQLIEYLGDLSPDFSRALWDFLRFCNPGWEAHAYKIGSDQQVIDDGAEEYLNLVLNTLDNLHGAFDVVLNRIFIGGFMRGAFLAEIVFAKRGREVVDIVTPDPGSIRFRRELDPALKYVDRIGQWQNGVWVSLDVPTVRYVPVDPYPATPYGRPIASPAIFSALFLLGLLHDLRRVVAQQGYPRLDLTVDLEKLSTSMPANVASDPEAFKAWVDDTIAEIKKVYQSLQPDDAYIHTSVVAVNRPVGTVDSSSLGAVDGLIAMLDRRAVQALKTMPLLMGITETAGEAHANRQWEVHVQGIKALQHYVESMLERMLGLALQGAGYQADLVFRFSELRAAELLRDEQVKQIKTDNAKVWYDQGWISQDEAAEYAVGHKADAPEPRGIDLAKELAEAGGGTPEEPPGKPKGDQQIEDGEEPVAEQKPEEEGK